MGILQNNWIRWLKGSVCIELQGDCVERFFNICRMNNICIWNISYCDEGAGTDIEKARFRCEMYAPQLISTSDILRKTNTKIHIEKKYGLPFYLPFVKKRIIFFIGIILCIAFLRCSTEYVWAIEYSGNCNITSEQLSDFLSERNIHYGIKKDKINCEEEEKQLRTKFANVTWTSIYFEGTKLVVELKENDIKEIVKSDFSGKDILATEDGVIISIITRNGVPKVKAGDKVEKGQVLVEGKVPVYDEEQNVVDYQIYDADADIYIQTILSYDLNINRKYNFFTYTDNNSRGYFIELLGYHFETMEVKDVLKKIGEKISIIDEVFGKDNDKKDTKMLEESILEKKQLVLLEDIYLPVYYGTINRKQYYVKHSYHTQAEMQGKLTDELEKIILCLSEKGVQIVEKNVKIEHDGNGMTMHVELMVNKLIGIEPVEM